MTQEVQALRVAHNFAPDSAIHDVAAALRRNIDQAALDRVLAELPRGAAQFWKASCVRSSRSSLPAFTNETV